jgi:hypothetical protein
MDMLGAGDNITHAAAHETANAPGQRIEDKPQRRGANWPRIATTPLVQLRHPLLHLLEPTDQLFHLTLAQQPKLFVLQLVQGCGQLDQV